MQETNTVIKFFVTLGKTATILGNRFDRGLGGLGFNEFLILYYLSQADEQKMRRVDLAGKVGMTPSGVTRLLLPMEKIHLLKKGPPEEDARARFVTISTAGKEKLAEAIERLEELAEDIIPKEATGKLGNVIELLIAIAGKALVA